jgi:hypothetical protein
MSSRVMVKDLISGRVGDQKGYSGSSRCVYTWENGELLDVRRHWEPCRNPTLPVGVYVKV